MKLTRRDLAVLLPALTAAQTSTPNELLPSNSIRNDDLVARKSGSLVSRQMLKGNTHTGYLLDLHESELAPGQAPHPPHRHLHEELLLIREGVLEVTIGHKSTSLGPGSTAYMASNQEHGWRNSGSASAKYFVLALGGDQA